MTLRIKYLLSVLLLLSSILWGQRSKDVLVLDHPIEIEGSTFVEIYQQSTDLLGSVNENDSLKAGLYLFISNLFLRESLFDSAQVYHDKAFKIIAGLGLSKSLGDLYQVKGKLYFNRRKFTNAFEYFNLAITVYNKVGYTTGSVDCYLKLAEIYNIVGEINTAIKYCGKAFEILDKNNNDSLRTFVNLTIGDIYHKHNKNNISFHYYNRALELGEDGNYERLLGIVYTKLGKLYSAEGMYTKSDEFLDKALQLVKKNKLVTQESKIYSIIGYNYRMLGRHDDALEADKKALWLRKKWGNKLLTGYSLINLGNIYFADNNLKVAEKMYDEGVDTLETLEHLPALKYAYSKIYLLKEKVGNYKEAYKYYKATEALEDSLSYADELANLIKKQTIEELNKKEEEISGLSMANKENRTLFLSAGIIFILFIISLTVTYLYFKNKKYSSELFEAKTEAEKANELKSQFLSQMSHEVRTPLNSISNFSSILKEELEGNLNPEIEETLVIIDNEIIRLIRTMELILDMAQIESNNYIPKPKAINIFDECIKPEVNHYMGDIKEKGIDLIFIKNVEKPIVWGDSHAIQQIVKNILDNAVKYTLEGSIEIVINKEVDNKVRLIFVDTGVGISEEYLQRLYVPFTQEDQSYTRAFEGNGLGLALVKRFCDLIGATIEIESVKNEGTKVSIVFNAV